MPKKSINIFGELGTWRWTGDFLSGLYNIYLRPGNIIEIVLKYQLQKPQRCALFKNVRLSIILQDNARIRRKRALDLWL